MAENRRGGRDSSGTAGGADVEPLHDDGTPREGTPPEPGEAGESAAHPDHKIEQERRDYEHEGAPPPR